MFIYSTISISNLIVSHTHAHWFSGHLPGEFGLAGCPLSFSSLFPPRLCMLPGQDKPFHILFDTIVPCFPQTISFAVQHLIQSVTLRSMCPNHLVWLGYKICLLIFKYLHQTAPVTVISDPVSASASRSQIRSAACGDLAVPRSQTTTYGQKFFRLWSVTVELVAALCS